MPSSIKTTIVPSDRITTTSPATASLPILTLAVVAKACELLPADVFSEIYALLILLMPAFELFVPAAKPIIVPNIRNSPINKDLSFMLFNFNAPFGLGRAGDLMPILSCWHMFTIVHGYFGLYKTRNS